MEHCGYFGKRPLERDFVFDGLAAGMTDVWAGLMSDWLASVQTTLPATWKKLYFEGPAWRFAIGPGLIGGTAWCGLLSASVDAVGRSFPLAALMQTGGPVRRLLFDRSAEKALDSLELQLMAFIEAQITRKQFLSAIAEHGNSLVRLQEGIPSTSRLEPDAGERALRVSFARTDGEAILADDAMSLRGPQAASPDLPLSYWWQDGGTARPPELCVWKGLPRGEGTGGFFSGEWRTFGWKRGQIDPDRILRP
ncbi:type VI secretion system-associated protein TagF [Roseibium marinum]|uniref:Type VI secretion system ImpM family protein n=1 Tax=Roseibium marinum TaxID=281252 RepID=A0A2S3V1G1_9HYPH|nr:type VI secretion system-associated protein TagF [Roseibium marinum]POF33788.1 type VI secretion system ImpM family protein [Roseibium marinum]